MYFIVNASPSKVLDVEICIGHMMERVLGTVTFRMVKNILFSCECISS